MEAHYRKGPIFKHAAQPEPSISPLCSPPPLHRNLPSLPPSFFCTMGGGPKADKDGWVKVVAKKSDYQKKRAEEEKEKLEAKKAKDEQAKKGFNNLVKSAKKEEEERIKREEAEKEANKKKPKSEQEKAAARKLRKKEKVEKVKEEEKKKPFALSPKNSTSTVAKLATNIPTDVASALKALPAKYPGRVKEQFKTAVLLLDSLFPAGTVSSKTYKTLSQQERWALPLSADTTGVLQKHIKAVIDESSDVLMWNASARDLIMSVFGRDGDRQDEGTHFLGSKFILQVLLQHFPAAFTCRPTTLEGVFLHEGGAMVGPATVNYAWVMGQLGDNAACVAVTSWSRVFFYPHIASNGGRGGNVLASDSGCAVADHLAALDPSEEVRKQYLNETKHHDPLEKELYAILPLLQPKMNRQVRLFKTLFPKYSALFTPTSPHAHFTKLMLLLRTANDISRPLLLDLLVDSVVLDTGCVYAWGNDFLMLVKETSELLEHINKAKADLRSRLDGAEMGKLFEKITTLCNGVADGTVERPSGKKGKVCNYEAADIQAAKAWVKKASSLSKAVPKNAPASNKKAQQKMKLLEAQKKSGGLFTTLFVFIIAAVLLVYLALPYMPEEHANLIKENYAELEKQVRHHANTAATHAAPHVEKAKQFVTSQMS